jgi:hypothetical protein
VGSRTHAGPHMGRPGREPALLLARPVGYHLDNIANHRRSVVQRKPIRVAVSAAVQRTADAAAPSSTHASLPDRCARGRMRWRAEPLSPRTSTNKMASAECGTKAGGRIVQPERKASSHQATQLSKRLNAANATLWLQTSWCHPPGRTRT